MTEFVFRHLNRDFRVSSPDDIKFPVHVFLEGVLRPPWNVIVPSPHANVGEVEQVFWFDITKPVYVAVKQSEF